MKTPLEPLTPEERALAQSLSRLGPHGGPSPGLDARILAAAREAVQEAPAPGGQVPPPRRRWPLGLGVIYGTTALVAGGFFVAEAVLLAKRSRRGEPLRPMRLFHWSITYLTIVFLAIAIDVLV